MSHRGWYRKFAAAISGLMHSVSTQNSFWVHLPITFAVIVLATWLQVESWRWAALVLAIAIVLSSELVNSAIECLVQVLHPQHDDRIGRVLDAAAAGVLVASIGAVVVGLIALGPPLWDAIVAR